MWLTPDCGSSEWDMDMGRHVMWAVVSPAVRICIITLISQMARVILVRAAVNHHQQGPINHTHTLSCIHWRRKLPRNEWTNKLLGYYLILYQVNNYKSLPENKIILFSYCPVVGKKKKKFLFCPPWVFNVVKLAWGPDLTKCHLLQTTNFYLPLVHAQHIHFWSY